MKKTNKKLRLDRETIAPLNGDELGGVNGGQSVMPQSQLICSDDRRTGRCSLPPTSFGLTCKCSGSRPTSLPSNISY